RPPDRLGRLRCPPRRPPLQPRPVVGGLRRDDPPGPRDRRRSGADPGGRLRPDRALRKRLGSPPRPVLTQQPGQTPMLREATTTNQRPSCGTSPPPSSAASSEPRKYRL